MTKARQGIAGILSEAGAPLAAADILGPLDSRLRGDDIKKLRVNKTTVYRELEMLRAENLILEVDFGDAIKRYELADSKHHHHLICVGCTRVQDVEVDAPLAATERRLERQTSFKIERHALEFFGLCAQCRFPRR